MKAIGLLSGGLDSALAIKLMREQQIEMVAVHFLTPFCTCDNNTGCGSGAHTLAQQLGVPLRVEFLGQEYLEIVKNPPHGYGKNLNPCIDCRILIFKRAKEIMQTLGASFVVTGEVLGQRPMSQHKRALKIIEEESGLQRLVVRPLSAKLFEPSLPEERGWVDRESLLDISGRTRKPQLQLANVFGIENYLCAAGGCLLTESSFCGRVKDLCEHGTFDLENAKLLRLGRHFRITSYFKLIVGRDQGENERLLKYNQHNYVLFQPKETKGPLALGVGQMDEMIKGVSARIVARYCSSVNGERHVSIAVLGPGGEEVVAVDKLDDKDIEQLRI